jgi:hypothetical protein
MTVKRKRVELWLAITGLILVAPGVAWLFSFRLTGDDAGTAFTRLARIPLEHLEKTRSAAVIVTVPDNVQWQRVRRAWGDPGYILAAVSPPHRNLVHCFDGLGTEAEVMRGGARIPLEAASAPPYGLSTECQANGLKFLAPPGSELTIRVLATSQQPLPAGELILMSYWNDRTKDRLVGVDLDEDLGKVLRVTSGIGLILMLSAACLATRRNISSHANRGCL